MYDKIGSTKTISQRIEEEIGNAIKEKRLSSGEKLPTELELSKSYGVSRNALREALRSLNSRGLIRIEKGRGMFVSEYTLTNAISSVNFFLEMNTTEENLLKVIRLRQLFEPEIAVEACRNRTYDDLSKMEESIVSMENKLPDNLKEEALEDNNFHKLIAKATHNFVIQVVMDPVYSLMPKFVDFVYGKKVNMKENTLNFHRRLLEEIEKRNEIEARKTMLKHLELTEKVFMSIKKDK